MSFMSANSLLKGGTDLFVKNIFGESDGQKVLDHFYAEVNEVCPYNNLEFLYSKTTFNFLQFVSFYTSHPE